METKEVQLKVDKIQYENNFYLSNTPKPKSKGIIGNITIYFPKTFNCLQRFMWKQCFGLEISNIEE